MMLTLKSDEDEVSALNSKKTRAEMAYVAAVDAKAKASALTSKFDELESVRGRALELEGRRDEFQMMTATRDMLNRSAPVAEAETLLRTLNANLMDTEEELERVEDDIRSLEAEYETAMADSERAAAMVADAEKMKVANVRIRDMLPRYERVEELRRSVAGTRTELETLNASAEEMADRLEQFSARISDIGERLEGSADIDSRIRIEEMAVEGTEADLSRLSADRARGSACLKAEDVVRRLENSFAFHDAQARAIAAELEESESLFLRSQAGLIAADLSEGVPCPVCGSLHHPSPAPLETDVPNENLINRLRKKKEKEDAARTKASEELASYRGGYEADLARLREASGTHGTATEAMETLDDVISRKQKELAQHRKSLNDMVAARRGLDTFRTELESLTRESRDTSEALESVMIKISESERRLSADGAELAVVTEGLEYLSAEEAARTLRENTENIQRAEDFSRTVTSKKESLTGEIAVRKDRRSKAEEEIKELTPRLDEAGARLNSLLSDMGMNLEEFHRLRETDADALNSAIDAFAKEDAYCHSRIAELGAELEGLDKPDTGFVKEAVRAAGEARTTVAEKLAKATERLRSNRGVWQFLSERWAELEARGQELEALKRMADVANGTVAGSRKIMFEQYVQTMYFDRVLNCANRRLSDMSDGRFVLIRKVESTDNRSQTALDLDVLDNFTGKVRSVKSLSGGESFKAALSLALGLSDSIQMMAGGSRVDALFIDEGFGSLDSDSLEQALHVLNSLTRGDVMVGVISHVDLLRERIDRKISVTRTKEGSRVDVITD